MSKVKNTTQPATTQENATIDSHESEAISEREAICARVEASIFDLCDLLGMPRDLEAFSIRIREHSALQEFIPHKDDPFLTLQEAGDLIGRSGTTIGNWIREGYVESEIDPSGLRRVRRSQLLKFFNGTAFARPFSVDSMTKSQRDQFDVDIQTRYATIFCKYCNSQVIKLTDRPRDWIAIHMQTCNAEILAEKQKELNNV